LPNTILLNVRLLAGPVEVVHLGCSSQFLFGNLLQGRSLNEQMRWENLRGFRDWEKSMSDTNSVAFKAAHSVKIEWLRQATEGNLELRARVTLPLAPYCRDGGNKIIKRYLLKHMDFSTTYDFSLNAVMDRQLSNGAFSNSSVEYLGRGVFQVSATMKPIDASDALDIFQTLITATSLKNDVLKLQEAASTALRSKVVTPQENMHQLLSEIVEATVSVQQAIQGPYARLQGTLAKLGSRLSDDAMLAKLIWHPAADELEAQLHGRIAKCLREWLQLQMQQIGGLASGSVTELLELSKQNVQPLQTTTVRIKVLDASHDTKAPRCLASEDAVALLSRMFATQLKMKGLCADLEAAPDEDDQVQWTIRVS